MSAPSVVTQQVKAYVDSFPAIRPYSYIVGQWVWIEFPGKPAADILSILKKAGFRWNGKRKVWQHNCGVMTGRMKNGDPRDYYGINRTETNGAGIDHFDRQNEDNMRDMCGLGNERDEWEMTRV